MTTGPVQHITVEETTSIQWVKESNKNENGGKMKLTKLLPLNIFGKRLMSVMFKTIRLPDWHGSHNRCCQRSRVRYPFRPHYSVSPSAHSRRAVVSYWRKYVHELLVNRFGGLRLPSKSVITLTDRPDMTSAVYHGRKTKTQQQQQQQVVKGLQSNVLVYGDTVWRVFPYSGSFKAWKQLFCMFCMN